MKYYLSNADVRFEEKTADFEDRPNVEARLIKVYPQVKKQEIIGFGGALTESSAYVWSRMSKQKQEELIELYFSDSGNRYNFGRTHIQSCDFSLGNRAYVEEGDKELKTFSIEGDRKYQIPFIKAALDKNKDIELLASPWSPPAFMKSNNEMNHGGKLLEEYYGAWAKIMVKYLLAYREEGIDIKRISVQNEPAATQTWDSCVYTAEQEGEFAVGFLRRELDAAGLEDIKILVWDHNKDRIIERAEGSFSIPGAEKAIDGVGFHWYTGDHFEALQYVRDLYPDKELIFTEGCVEYSRFADKGQIDYAEMYAHDMIGNLKSGMNGFLDWNIILDTKGGPNHVGNFCDAPIMCDADNDTIDVKLSYYYIGHFSRFIKKGARCLLTSVYDKGLESVAFENLDGGIVTVVLNTTDEDKPFELWIEGKGCQLTIPAHSIITACM